MYQYLLENKIIFKFLEIYGYKKVEIKNCFPLLFIIVVRSGKVKIRIRDKYPGSAILVPIKEKYYQIRKDYLVWFCVRWRGDGWRGF
jgi:hypothetical protein